MSVRRLEIAEDDARPWIRQSLTAGFDVSTAVLAVDPFDRGRFFTFVPRDLASDQLEFPEGGIVPSGVADAGLAQFLNDVTADHPSRAVIIEDDVGRRGDPDLAEITIPSAFIGDRVLHWCDLEPGRGKTATDAIRQSAFGYPLNAFVTGRSSTDFHLVDGQPAPEGLAEKVVDSLVAIIVSAFDGQSFAVWTSE